MTAKTTPPPSLELRVEQLLIAELKPYGRQARHHNKRQLAGIKASIEQFGFVSPILIDGKGRIIAGNARVEAAKALGMETVPAVLIDHLTPEEIRAYVLADNRLAELGTWNREVLQLELEELSVLDLDFSIEVTGWTLPEIEAIRFDDGQRDPADDVPEPAAELVSKLGDLWLLGDHRLLVGDATSPAALERLLAGEQVRTAFTDPPYNVKIQGHVTSSKSHGDFVQASGEMSDPEFTDFLTSAMTQLDHALVDGGLAYVCMDWRHMKHVLDSAEAIGLMLVNLCVWDKEAAGMGSLYRSQHELVFVLKKGRASHQNNVQLGKHGRNRSNVWSYPGVAGFGPDKEREREMHPTVKPWAMVKDALLDSSTKGELVLDLFGGSGSTLIAAEKCGRRCRMMELTPKYADVIIRRWQTVSGREAVHAASGLTFREFSFGGRPEPTLPPARARVRLDA